jgi:hypothetical protein
MDVFSPTFLSQGTPSPGIKKPSPFCLQKQVPPQQRKHSFYCSTQITARPPESFKVREASNSGLLCAMIED